MSKTGKITGFNHIGKWDSGNQVYDTYEVSFATGEQFKFSAIGEFKYNVGEEVEFKITNPQYGNASIVRSLDRNYGGKGWNKAITKGDNPQPLSSNQPISKISVDRDTSIVRQSMLKAAVEYSAGKDVSTDDILGIARIFVNFVNNG